MNPPNTAHYQVSHRTTVHYSQTVSISHHALHVAPRPHPWQTRHATELHVDPAPAVSKSGVDYFGNPMTFVTVQERHSELVLCAQSVVSVEPAPPLPAASPAWEDVARALPHDLSDIGLDAYQFVFPSALAAGLTDLEPYARQSFTKGRPLLEAALDLTSRIHRDFAYDKAATTVSTPVDAVFAHKAGVCQDFAHLQIACLRRLGLPARYVSGYLLTHPPAGKPRLVGADASHAWLAIWHPGHGWIDLDPTNDKIPGTDYVTVAWGRDYGDVSPVRGVIIGGGEHSLSVGVDVVPLAQPFP